MTYLCTAKHEIPPTYGAPLLFLSDAIATAMKRFYTLTSLCLLLISLIGCTGNSKQEGNADSTQVACCDSTLPEGWDSIHIKTTYYDKQAARSGSSVHVDILFQYPTNDSGLLKTISKAFFGDAYATMSPKDALEHYLREVRSEYLFGADTLGFSAEELADMKSKLILANSITYHDDHIITMQKELYTYSAGAAHGLHGVGNYTIDRKSKDVISEGDLFIDGYEVELSKVLQRALLKSLGRKNAQEVEKEDGFSITDLPSNDNFRLDAKGMTYTYNPYEIAPYAMGVIEFFVPYEEVRHLLRPQSIIYNYIQH